MNFLYGKLHQIAKYYWKVRQPLSVGVKGLVFDKDQRVLLIRHSYQPGWHLPGGAVDKGENLLESVCREVREETGVICGPRAEQMLGAYYNFSEFKRDYVIVFVFREWEKADNYLRPSFEIQEARFFPLDELPQDTSRATRRRLDEYFKRVEQDFIW